MFWSLDLVCAGTRLRYISGGGKIYIYHQVVGQNLQTLEVAEEKTFQREEKLQVGLKWLVNTYQLNTMSSDHVLPNVLQHKISTQIVFISPICVILQSEFAVGDHISRLNTNHVKSAKSSSTSYIIHDLWYIFISSSRQLVWSYNLNSQSEILELLQKLKASDYRFDNQQTCCYCFEITKTVTHILKRYWKILKTKVMKILHCFILLSVEMLQQLKKILSNIAETATDLTVNFWVAIFISQRHINQVIASCFCSERKENNGMIRLVLKTKKSKNSSWQTTQGWKCRDEHPETEREDWPGEGSDTNTKLLAFVLNESYDTEWSISTQPPPNPSKQIQNTEKFIYV